MLKRLWPYTRYLRPVRWQFAGGILAGILYSVASGVGLPLMMKVVMPVIFGEATSDSSAYVRWMQSWMSDISPERLLLFSCLWIPFAFLLRAIGGYFNAYLINHCGFKVLEGLRIDLFTKLQKLPLSFFGRHRSGDLLARLTGDTEVLRQIIAQASSDVIKQPVTLLSAVGFLTYLSLRDEGAFVVLIAIVSVPLCVLPIRLAAKKLMKRAVELQRGQGDLSAYISENLQAPLEVRSYNLQEQQNTSFVQKIRQIFRSSMKIVKYRQAISPSIEVVAAAGFALALFLGKGTGMTFETFSAMGMALYMAYEPVKKLGNLHGLLRQGEASLDRIEMIMQAEDSLPDPEEPKVLGHADGAVAFRAVDFGYGDELVLTSITVEIPAGQCIALVGASGAGKSTFATLIPRFYDPVGGEVLFDGVDVRELCKHELRAQVAVVPQAPILFSGSIRENIRIGREGASDEDVEEAAKRAHAHEFILQKPGGYDAQVSEKGTSLSGGQRQRIALARAFLKDAPVLILDEATSALDNESESKIQEALQDLVKGRTTIIIAHRLSTTRIAERVLVFDRGRITQDLASSDFHGSDRAAEVLPEGMP